MDAAKLAHFRTILNKELQRHSENVRDEQANALAATDDGVKDVADMSQQDLSQETAFKLGERESKMITEIEEALMRIDDGTYGTCARCGKPIDERRLEAMPTARYDAACQALIEESDGTAEETPSL